MATLDSLGRDLSQQIWTGEYQPVCSTRCGDVERVIEVLLRRDANNSLLLGDSSFVLKSIVDELARRTRVGWPQPEMIGGEWYVQPPPVGQNVTSSASDLLPAPLRASRILSLDHVPDEATLRTALQEINNRLDHILLLDVSECDDTQKSGEVQGIPKTLKTWLVDGKVTCIIAMRPSQYQELIGSDSELSRAFQVISIDPYSKHDALEALRGKRDEYEVRHRVEIPDDALEAAVELSDRFITSGCLPDKALDVIDEASALAGMNPLLAGAPALWELDEQIERLNQDKEEAVANHEFERAVELSDQANKLKTMKETIICGWHEVIAQVVNRMTNISLSVLESSETGLVHLEDQLAKRVVGQPEAIQQVCDALRRYGAGLSDPVRPVGCFLFVGPTGVGKTQLARVLAEVAFDSPDALIVLNMAQYADESAVSHFGDQLAEAIRRRPHSIVLLEQIDKAHRRARDMLLPVMETGRLTDSSGRKVDLRAGLLIMTTNVGAEVLSSTNTFGFGRDEDADFRASKERLPIVLERDFSPEFLGRLDDVILFRTLGRKQIQEIVPLLVDVFETSRLADRRLQLELTDEAVEHLVQKGYNVDYGAWALLRAFADLVEGPIIDDLLRGKLRGATKIIIRRELGPDGEGRLVIEPAA